MTVVCKSLTMFSLKALVKLAEEIAQSAIPEGSRKINGKYIQSHLVSRLEGRMVLQFFCTPYELFHLYNAMNNCKENYM